MNNPNLLKIAEAICKNEGFRFVKPTNEGAFKQTFQVKSSQGNSLALKIYKSNSQNERAAREIDAMERCKHPNIATIIKLGKHSYGEAEFSYLVENFIDGGSLSEKINSKVFTPKQIKEMGSYLVDALGHLYELELVHRDIKPDNIMFVSQDSFEPILVDFGLVRDLNASSLTKSWLAFGPGTPLYASPEQLNNQKEMIHWQSDQFSLGVVLSLCILGYHPFAQKDSDDASVVTRVMSRQPMPKRTTDELNSKGMSLLLKMMAPYPIDRYRKPQILKNDWIKIKE
jgi:serine/threonine protein kinase